MHTYRHKSCGSTYLVWKSKEPYRVCVCMWESYRALKHKMNVLYYYWANWSKVISIWSRCVCYTLVHGVSTKLMNATGSELDKYADVLYTFYSKYQQSESTELGAWHIGGMCKYSHSQRHSHRVWNEDKCEFIAFLQFEQMVCLHVIESTAFFSRLR